MGSFTDFNVWRTELSTEEMINFTECRQEMAGNLLAWNSEDWTFTPDIEEEEFSVERVDFRSLCSSRARLTMFPERLTALQAFHLCGVFGGDLVVTREEAQYVEVSQLLANVDSTQLKQGSHSVKRE